MEKASELDVIMRETDRQTDKEILREGLFVVQFVLFSVLLPSPNLFDCNLQMKIKIYSIFEGETTDAPFLSFSLNETI